MLPGLSRGAHPVGGWAPLPLAECCRADTPLASLRNVSRRRLTTDQPGRFVTPRWLTLILRCDRPVVGLSALRHAPPALGPMTMSTVPGPVLRDLSNGTGNRTRPRSPGGIEKGNEIHMRLSSPRRTARGRHHDEAIWHSVGRKVASDTSLWKCCNPDTSGGKRRWLSRGSNLPPALATTYSRTVRRAPHPPDG
jgi:hypothetical protein